MWLSLHLFLAPELSAKCHFTNFPCICWNPHFPVNLALEDCVHCRHPPVSTQKGVSGHSSAPSTLEVAQPFHTSGFIPSFSPQGHPRVKEDAMDKYIFTYLLFLHQQNQGISPTLTCYLLQSQFRKLRICLIRVELMQVFFSLICTWVKMLSLKWESKEQFCKNKSTFAKQHINIGSHIYRVSCLYKNVNFWQPG